MLLDGNDEWCGGHCLEHGSPVDRLYGGHVDHRGLYLPVRQQLGRLQRYIHHVSTSDERKILPLAEDHSASQLKLIAAIQDIWDRIPAQADVNRPVYLLCHGHGHGSRLHAVGGDENSHVGQRTHQGDVLQRLVASPIRSLSQASARARQDNVKLRVGDLDAYLTVAAPRDKDGERVTVGDQARCGHACPRADHIRLGNTHVDETVGIGIAEEHGAGRLVQIRVKHHNVGMCRAHLSERLAVHISRLPQLTHITSSRTLYTSASSSERACSSCSAVSAALWNSGRPSMKEIPFPLTV